MQPKTVLLATFCLCAVATTAAGQQTRTVRVVNHCDVNIRVRGVGFGPDVHFTIDVPQGQTRNETGVFTGHRGVVVYNSATRESLAVGHFHLKPEFAGVAAVVVGNATEGYRVVFEPFVE